MTKDELIQHVLQQEQETVLHHFTSGDIRRLADYLMDVADGLSDPVTVRISLGKQIVFQYTANGCSPDKEHWLDRKSNTVFNFHHASLWMYYKTDGDNSVLEKKYGLSTMEYTVSDGAVPICVDGVGFIGVLAMSGIPVLLNDHKLCIEALKWLKGEQENG